MKSRDASTILDASMSKIMFRLETGISVNLSIGILPNIIHRSFGSKRKIGEADSCYHVLSKGQPIPKSLFGAIIQ